MSRPILSKVHFHRPKGNIGFKKKRGVGTKENGEPGLYANGAEWVPTLLLTLLG